MTFWKTKMNNWNLLIISWKSFSGFQFSILRR
nr:MAG TPA: Protein of unknown function (DUF2956) [Caudoviricetes sp.]DAS11108.1 MAG TPA: Protein of unknown function (DUF2956) [Caudoviricetes sp.]